MKTFFNKFLKDESGAVTVDWVVLTAAVVGLAIAAYSTISGSTDTLLGEIDTAIQGVDGPTAPGGGS